MSWKKNSFAALLSLMVVNSHVIAMEGTLKRQKRQNENNFSNPANNNSTNYQKEKAQEVLKKIDLALDLLNDDEQKIIRGQDSLFNLQAVMGHLEKCEQLLKEAHEEKASSPRVFQLSHDDIEALQTKIKDLLNHKSLKKSPMFLDSVQKKTDILLQLAKGKYGVHP
jgi:hypothetical protein